MDFLEITHAYQIKLPTDSSYILEKASSVNECIFFGCMYLLVGIALTIFLIILYGITFKLNGKINKTKNISDII